MSIDSWVSDVDLAPRKPLIEEEAPAKNAWLRRISAAIRIDRSHVKPIAVLLIVALLASFWLFWHSRVRETQISIPKPTISEGSGAELSKVATNQVQIPVVVDVGGRVKRPGVYTLPAGSRAIDAITAAGGALPGTDMTTVNQASPLEDGEQLVVGADVNSTASSTVRGGKVNLNSASAQDLDALPGIGPVLAARIVAWRKANGRFKSVEDLRQVSGVGDAKFADLRPLVRI